jgi:hypothetical protein
MTTANAQLIIVIRKQRLVSTLQSILMMKILAPMIIVMRKLVTLNISQLIAMTITNARLKNAIVRAENAFQRLLCATITMNAQRIGVVQLKVMAASCHCTTQRF